MIGASGAGIVAADRRYRGTVGEEDSFCLRFGFRFKLGFVRDDAFHRLIDMCEGLLQVIGEDTNFIVLGLSRDRGYWSHCVVSQRQRINSPFFIRLAPTLSVKQSASLESFKCWLQFVKRQKMEKRFHGAR